MKIDISRQNIYLLALSIFLLLFVMIFSFAVLIPNGKEYREQRVELKKVNRELRRYQDFHFDTSERLKKLKVDNGRIITAFETKFNAKRFEKQHVKYFNSLELFKVTKSVSIDNDFVEYEVNTTSQINSPKAFYDFLDAINKSDWIISVNFPINFKREEDLIRSSFTMKVYLNNRDANTTETDQK